MNDSNCAPLAEQLAGDIYEFSNVLLMHKSNKEHAADQSKEEPGQTHKAITSGTRKDRKILDASKQSSTLDPHKPSYNTRNKTAKKNK
jgi:hypothetical protein